MRKDILSHLDRADYIDYKTRFKKYSFTNFCLKVLRLSQKQYRIRLVSNKKALKTNLDANIWKKLTRKRTSMSFCLLSHFLVNRLVSLSNRHHKV